MDIEPTTMGGRKTLDLIQKNDMEHRLSIDGNDASNKSSFFDHLYFWSIFLLSTSFFLDLTFYFCYYQKKRNDDNYQPRTFFVRVITDVLFISPLLMYLRFALDNVLKNYILGIIIFLPQFILNLISIIDIHIQDFVLSNKNGTNTTDIDGSDSPISHNDTIFNNIINDTINILANDTSNSTTNDTTNNTTSEKMNLNNMRINILKISPSINMVIYIITVLLTYLRVYKNKN